MNNFPTWPVGPETPPPVQPTVPTVRQPITPRFESNPGYVSPTTNPYTGGLSGYRPPTPATTPAPPTLDFSGYNALIWGALNPYELGIAKSRAQVYVNQIPVKDITPEQRRNYLQILDDAAGTMAKLLGGGGGGGGGSALGLASLAEEQRQFNEQMQFTREKEQRRIQEAMSDLKMTGASLQNRALTDAASLVAQVAPFNIPAGMEYLPGREPGGTLSALAKMGGWEYTPQQAVGTPLNPNVIPQQAQQGIFQALANLGGV